jgi:hypothetical protein
LVTQFRELLDRAMGRRTSTAVVRQAEMRVETTPAAVVRSAERRLETTPTAVVLPAERRLETDPVPASDLRSALELAVATFQPAWEEDVAGVGPYGAVTTYNRLCFATRETAEQLAAMLGGTVEEVNFQGPFSRSHPERIIVVGKARMNAGMLADMVSRYNPALAEAMIQETIDRANAPAKKSSPGEDT